MPILMSKHRRNLPIHQATSAETQSFSEAKQRRSANASTSGPATF